MHSIQNKQFKCFCYNSETLKMDIHIFWNITLRDIKFLASLENIRILALD